MDRRRLLIIIIIFFTVMLLGALGTWLFAFDGLVRTGLVNATETPIPPTPTATLLPGTPTPTPVFTPLPDQEFVEVVVSLQTIQQERGYQMTEAEVTTELRLASEVGSNVITDVNDVIGKFTRRKVYQGETLTYDAFVDDLTEVGREEYGPSSLIPQGFVAMAVPMDRLAGVGYALESGDSIDILVSFVLLPVDEQFQTRLHNQAVFYVTQEEEIPDPNNEGEVIIRVNRTPYVISPEGRFETLPTGDTALIQPSESFARGTHVSFVIQNARVIEVGTWLPPLPPQVPTPTPDPDANVDNQNIEPNEEETSLDQIAARVDEIIDEFNGPPYSEVVLVALPPQQQVFLKYAVESESTIDFALRADNDNQFYPVENVTFDYILERFNVEIPPNFTYIVNTDGNLFNGQQTDEGILSYQESEEQQVIIVDDEAAADQQGGE